MDESTQIRTIGRIGRNRDGALQRLLRGYRFRVCETAEDAERALAVRRRVYVEESGYDIPVPDEYDDRSWLLIAESEATGEAVGTIRVTARAAGPLEAEEYFRLPAALRGPRVVEISRFAILPDHRKSRTLMPAVALGLFKAVIQLLGTAGVERAVVCAKPERVWTYSWMRFQPTGVSMPYRKLGGAMHELLFVDLRYGFEMHEDHRFYDFFIASKSSEIQIPDVLAAPGAAMRGTAHGRAQALAQIA